MLKLFRMYGKGKGKVLQYVWYVMVTTSSDTEFQVFSSKKKLAARIDELLKEFYDYPIAAEVKVSDSAFSVYDKEDMIIVGEYGKKLVI